LVTGALTVSQGQKHQRVEVGAVTNDRCELGNGGAIIEVPFLRGKGKLVMGVDQRNEHAATLGRKLQTSRDFLGKHRAGILVIALVPGLPRVMQKQSQIENRRVLELLKQGAITPEFFPLREKDAVELFDAHQSMLVGRIAVVKLVLNKAGEGTELRDVSSKKSQIVHLSKDSTHLAFA
jgi:hypothetical protein